MWVTITRMYTTHDYMTYPEASERFSVTERQIRHYAETGKINRYRKPGMGRRTLFRISELEALFHSEPQAF